MELVSTWEGGFRCRVEVRDFELLADESEEAGGDDAGPMPTELFLSALATCYTMALVYVARKRDVEFEDLSVRVRGEYEGPRFTRIRIDVRSDSPPDDVESLMQRALRFCYVTNTLRKPPHLEFALEDRLITDVPPAQRP